MNKQVGNALLIALCAGCVAPGGDDLDPGYADQAADTPAKPKAKTDKKPGDKSLENAVDDLLNSAGKEEAARINIRAAVREFVEAAAKTDDKEREAQISSAQEKLKLAAPDLPKIESGVTALLEELRARSAVAPGAYPDRATDPRLVLVTGDPHTSEFRRNLVQYGLGRTLSALAWNQETGAGQALTVLSRETDQGQLYLPMVSTMEDAERRAHNWGRVGWTLADIAYRETRDGWNVAFWTRRPNSFWRKSLVSDYRTLPADLRAITDAGWEPERFYSTIRGRNSSKSDAVAVLQNGRTFKLQFNEPDAIGAVIAEEQKIGFQPKWFGYVGSANSAAWVYRAGEKGAEYKVVVGLESPAALVAALEKMPGWSVAELFYRGTGTGVWLECDGRLEPVFEESSSDTNDIKFARLMETVGSRLDQCKPIKLFHNGTGAVALFSTGAK